MYLLTIHLIILPACKFEEEDNSWTTD